MSHWFDRLKERVWFAGPGRPGARSTSPPPRDPPVGFDVPRWETRPRPAGASLRGCYCRLERLDPQRHAQALFAANALDRSGHGWTYLPYGPFRDRDEYVAWVTGAAAGGDPLFYAIVVPGADGADSAVGVASYLRIAPEMGSIEVGHIRYAPPLQRTRAATEAMYLMMRHAFDDLGYRRYEWKCDALNAPSRRAAERLGFTCEGVFRQHGICKGRNRDTAWYSVIDRDWPRIGTALRAWLHPDNFGADGRQLNRLEEIRGEVEEP